MHAGGTHGAPCFMESQARIRPRQTAKIHDPPRFAFQILNQLLVFNLEEPIGGNNTARRAPAAF